MYDQISDYWPTYSNQRTLKHKIHCSGVGIHNGKISTVELVPAAEDQGIIFHIMNKDSVKAEIRATASNIRVSMLRTVLQDNHSSIDTVEHLLAALSVYNINNAVIRVWGDEIPILDGSSEPWTFLINSAGIVEQSAPVRYIKILQPIEITDENSFVRLEPSLDTEISYLLHYDNPDIGTQQISITLDRFTFDKEISKSRTFGFYKDLDFLQMSGLARGVDLTNTVVFDDSGLMKGSVLRYPDEPIRHKILDVIGDLSLAESPIIGKFTGYLSGHELNHKLVIEMLNNRNTWEYTY